MKSKEPFKLGVVEGFFGLPWSWQARKDYSKFLSKNNFNTYLYAPKADSFLRKNWHQPFPLDHFKQLKSLSEHYANAALDFGIGLSPFELYRDFNSAQKDLLKNKLNQINQIAPNTLCILFDDMPGELPDLAMKQVEIMNFVMEHSKANNFTMCPTYYSDDPLLEKHFGQKPDNYLEDLGSLLDTSVDIFWTGPQVVSKELSLDHLAKVTHTLQRKPLIWDNYPVNDSLKLSNFLNISPVKHRDSALAEACSGYMANPMNQPYLSQLPLYNLGKLFLEKNKQQEISLSEACIELCPDDLSALLLSDKDTFQNQGLDSLSKEERSELVKKYSPYKKNPMVIEILDWLDNKYIFDPACLT